MRTGRNIVLVTSVGILVGFSVLLALNWKSVSPHLFSLSASDLFDNVIALFIGVIATMVLGVRFSNRHKQFDILHKVFDMYLEDLRYVMKVTDRVAEGKVEFDGTSLGKELQHLLRLGSNDLNTVIALMEKCGEKQDKITRLMNEFFALKNSLTNHEFRNLQDLETSLVEVTQCYYAIKNTVHLQMLSLYT